MNAWEEALGGEREEKDWNGGVKERAWKRGKEDLQQFQGGDRCHLPNLAILLSLLHSFSYL
jgi:hypothetical protein